MRVAPQTNKSQTCCNNRRVTINLIAILCSKPLGFGPLFWCSGEACEAESAGKLGVGNVVFVGCKQQKLTKVTSRKDGIHSFGQPEELFVATCSNPNVEDFFDTCSFAFDCQVLVRSNPAYPFVEHAHTPCCRSIVCRTPSVWFVQLQETQDFMQVSMKEVDC